MRLTVTVLACALAAGGPSLAQSPAAEYDADDRCADPLKRAASPAISPDARWVAYTIRETNWDENVYETEIWLADAQSGSTRQLTNGRKSSNAPAWSPDGKRLAFGSDRDDKRQIFLIDLGGGEAIKLTSAEESVGGFGWSPDGRSIAFTSNEPRAEAIKEREKKHAEFDVIDQDHRLSHLFVVDVESKAIRRLTSGAFTVGRFEWSPDSRQIAFDHRINGDPANGGSADISVVTVADGAVRKLVTQEGPDVNPQWSPDGSQIAFEFDGQPAFFFTNRRIAVMPAAGGTIAICRLNSTKTRPLFDGRRAASSSRRLRGRGHTSTGWTRRRKPSRGSRLQNAGLVPASASVPMRRPSPSPPATPRRFRRSTSRP